MPWGRVSFSDRSSTARDSWRTSSTFTSACSRVLWRSLTSSLMAFSSTFGIRKSLRTASESDLPTVSNLTVYSSIPLLNPVQHRSNDQWKTYSSITVHVHESPTLTDLVPADRFRQWGPA